MLQKKANDIIINNEKSLKGRQQVQFGYQSQSVKNQIAQSPGVRFCKKIENILIENDLKKTRILEKNANEKKGEEKLELEGFLSERKVYTKDLKKEIFHSDRKTLNLQQCSGFDKMKPAQKREQVYVKNIEENVRNLKRENEKLEELRKKLVQERTEFEAPNDHSHAKLVEKMKAISNCPILAAQNEKILELRAHLEDLKRKKDSNEVKLKEGTIKIVKQKKSRYSEELIRAEKPSLINLERKHVELENTLEDLKRKLWNSEKALQYAVLMKNENRFTQKDLDEKRKIKRVTG